MRQVLHHVRRNAVAYLALFVALGGTSYAALDLPAGSVGARQIKNHVIDPVKFNPNSIAASIRAWVIVQWRGGKLVAQASSSPVRVSTLSDGETLSWPQKRFARNCMPFITPQLNLGGTRLGGGGYLATQFDPTNPPGAFLSLFGFAPDGSRSAQAAYVLIICP